MEQVEINSAIQRLKFENPEAHHQLQQVLRSYCLARGIEPATALSDRVFAWVVVAVIVGANLFFLSGIVKAILN